MANTTKTNASNLRSRFNFLKSLFHQAPLSEPKFNELVQLAERFDKKMAKYLKTNRSELV